MISVTDLRAGIVFEDQGQYFLVLSYEHIKMGRGSGTVRVKVRNLESGANVDKTFNTGARVSDVNLSRKKAQFLYRDSRKFHLMDMDTYDQFEIDEKIAGDIAKFLKENMEVTLFAIGEKPLYIEIPKIVDYKITQTGGSAKGNTAGAAQKDAVLENGITVKVPLFIQNGEIIRVDTRSGQYVERAKS